MINYNILFLSFLASLLIGVVAVSMIKSMWARATLLLFHVSLFINSGVAPAYYDVPVWFAWYHFAFLIACSLSFVFFWRICSPFSVSAARKLELAAPFFLQKRLTVWILVVFYGALLSSLIYPELRLADLFELRPPDIRTWFASRFDPVEYDAVAAITRYIRLLVFPFVFIAFFRLCHRPLMVIGCVALALYIQYVDQQYIARGSVLLYALSIGLFYFIKVPASRKIIVATGFLALPLLGVLLEFWMVVRLGEAYEFRGVLQSLETILIMQTGFAREAGLILIGSGRHVDLEQYFLWILTLPLPKALVGGIEGARINYEISEIVLGLPRGYPGFYVILGGVVSESVYIYGDKLFWLHGVMLGAVGSVLIRLLSAVSYLAFLTAWTVVFFSYKMPGAGVGAVLPSFANEYMLLYVVMWYIASRYSRHRSGSRKGGSL